MSLSSCFFLSRTHALTCMHIHTQRLHGFRGKSAEIMRNSIEKMSRIPRVSYGPACSVVNSNLIGINYLLVFEGFFFLETHKSNNEKFLQNLFILHAGRNILYLHIYTDIKQTTLWSYIFTNRLQVYTHHRNKQNAVKIKAAVQKPSIFVDALKQKQRYSLFQILSMDVHFPLN